MLENIFNKQQKTKRDMTNREVSFRQRDIFQIDNIDIEFSIVL